MPKSKSLKRNLPLSRSTSRKNSLTSNSPNTQIFLKKNLPNCTSSTKETYKNWCLWSKYQKYKFYAKWCYPSLKMPWKPQKPWSKNANFDESFSHGTITKWKSSFINSLKSEMGNCLATRKKLIWQLTGKLSSQNMMAQSHWKTTNCMSFIKTVWTFTCRCMRTLKTGELILRGSWHGQEQIWKFCADFY